MVKNNNYSYIVIVVNKNNGDNILSTRFKTSSNILDADKDCLFYVNEIKQLYDEQFFNVEGKIVMI